MASSDIITAIDIGTTKICTIVARNCLLYTSDAADE